MHIKDKEYNWCGGGGWWCCCCTVLIVFKYINKKDNPSLPVVTNENPPIGIVLVHICYVSAGYSNFSLIKVREKK